MRDVPAIFHYNPVTLAFTGITAARESPREPGVFILPASATWLPPPDPQEGFVQRFNGSEWFLDPIPAPVIVTPEEPSEPVEQTPEDPLSKPLPRLTFWLLAASVQVSKWAVRDRIAAMPEATPEEFRVKAEAIAWFEEAGQYRRYDPILIAMAEAEGITSDQLDALWSWAV